MADFSEETTILVFSLQRQLLNVINVTTATALILFEQFGETDATIPELEQLYNVKERSTSSCSRLYTSLLRIAEAQPMASSATLKLLTQSIEQAQATIAASEASVQETRKNWNLS